MKKKNNLTLFLTSLRVHPGIPFGAVFTFCCFLALFQRNPNPSIKQFFMVFLISLVLVWIPILWTSWSMKNQYDKE